MYNLLFIATAEDKSYLPYLKPLLNGRANVWFPNKEPDMFYEMVVHAKDKGCRKVAVTSEKALKLLLDSNKRESLDDYSGSIIKRNDIEFLILNPVKHLMTVPYGKFLYERYLSKFSAPETWPVIPEFTWNLFEPSRTDEVIDIAQYSDLISYDIETYYNEQTQERYITSISFTFMRIWDTYNNKRYTLTTIVFPFYNQYNIAVVRTILANNVPKVTQNGKYDTDWLLLFNSPICNWAFDTLHMFHCWYSELPKDLGFITSFLLRDWVYWKDERHSSNEMDYFRYNAKDSYVTILDWIALLQQVPAYAINNYLQEFPLVFPCVVTELTGLKLDKVKKKELSEKVAGEKKVALKNLQKMVANENFNPGSWQQTLKLFELLGSGDIKSSGAIGRDKVGARHPLNLKIMDTIKTYRKAGKLNSSYLEKEYAFQGRCFYMLNPAGTDTGRLASKESNFWCGIQIQNVPSNAKEIFVADEGFYYGEADYSQNEARGTAYLSGDTNLIKAVDDESRDFHGHNASKFFGINYEEIVYSTYDEVVREWLHKTINKVIRDLSKRTNHGTNYNMTAGVLLDTMGIANVARAKILLRLPSSWTLKRVCQYLLDKYDETYPIVRSDWYNKCIADVVGNHKLVGPTEWTRYCFADPGSNKHYLNAYVAHPPQSLGAMSLNKAYLKVFYNIWLSNQENFKLGPQIHDSILFQYRKGHEYLAWMVKGEMHVPIEVTDTFGIKRVLEVPVDLKGGADRWSDVKSLKKISVTV